MIRLHQGRATASGKACRRSMVKSTKARTFRDSCRFDGQTSDSELKGIVKLVRTGRRKPASIAGRAT
jgi:hypothetical protein